MEKKVFNSFSKVIVQDDPDGIRKIDRTTLFVTWGVSATVDAMAWWSERDPNHTARPAAILGNDHILETEFPDMKKLLQHYVEVDSWEGCSSTDPFRDTALYLRKDLLSAWQSIKT